MQRGSMAPQLAFEPLPSARPKIGEHEIEGYLSIGRVDAHKWTNAAETGVKIAGRWYKVYLVRDGGDGYLYYPIDALQEKYLNPEYEGFGEQDFDPDAFRKHLSRMRKRIYRS